MRFLLSISVMLAFTMAGSGAWVGPAAVHPVAADSVPWISYRAPVAGAIRVLRPFQPPLHKYGPGHLGVDLAAGAGGQVLAAGPGLVRFAGRVAGRGVLVIEHPDGLSTEYEPVTGSVPIGARVRLGQQIGRVSGSHRGCPVSSCLHWGARRGADYLDPMSLLGPLGVVRLLPWDYSQPAGYPAGQSQAGQAAAPVWAGSRAGPGRGGAWSRRGLVEAGLAGRARSRLELAGRARSRLELAGRARSRPELEGRERMFASAYGLGLAPSGVDWHFLKPVGGLERSFS